MNIRAGSFFRTRDGRKARIYATDGNKPYPVHGSVDGNTEFWTDEGLWTFPGKSDGDLVAEWTEPKPRLKAWIDSTGGVVLRVEGEQGCHWTRAEWLDEK